jgi:hypothetical protein
VGPHRLELAGRRLEEARAEGAELVEFCAPFETVELWADPDPDAQLTLVWLLDYLRHHGKAASKLTLVQSDVAVPEQPPEAISRSCPPAVKILNDHLEAGSLAWRAYQQPTPRDWFKLLSKDLGFLPQLRQSVLELLEELPMRNQRRVFDYWEVGALLEGLARCPAPAVAGLEEGPFTEEMHKDPSRLERYKRSALKLTPLGEAILAGTEDFSRHNPVHRWWGGTELTNGRLWRWDPASHTLIAP